MEGLIKADILEIIVVGTIIFILVMAGVIWFYSKNKKISKFLKKVQEALLYFLGHV